MSVQFVLVVGSLLFLLGGLVCQEDLLPCLIPLHQGVVLGLSSAGKYKYV